MSVWADRAGGGAERPSPRQLLGRAQGLAGESPRQCLEALFCVDAARWLAWPADVPEARELEHQLLERAEAVVAAVGPAEALERSIAVRRAVHNAGPEQVDEGLRALGALPPGYSFKSAWLHWRDFLLATGQLHRWHAVRQTLRSSLQKHGVPLSETLPVLLGRIDVSRWRAERRLAATATTDVHELLERLEHLLTNQTAVRTYRAAAGHSLVLLGDEARGAAEIHRAVEGLPQAGLQATKLFTRPTPEAGVWLRRAAELAAATSDPVGASILRYAATALFALAARHRARHLLEEAIEGLPIRFERPDVSALVLTEGALAWLSCGDRWVGDEWLTNGLRLAARHRRAPLVREVLTNVCRWVERTADRAVLGTLIELVSRLPDSLRLDLEPHLACLYAAFGDRHLGWELLGSTYRRIRNAQPGRGIDAAVACVGALLAWGHDAVALALLRRIVGCGAEPSRWPANLAGSAADPGGEGAALRTLLAEQPCDPRATAAAIEVLLRSGHTDLAEAMHDAAQRAALASVDPLGAGLDVARRTSLGIDHDLCADVEEAVANEIADILERLRVDDPPRPQTTGAR